MEPDEAFFAWLDLRRTYAGVSRQLERRMRELGLTLAFAEVLVRLGQAPGGSLRVVELGEKVFLTRSGISQLLSRMEVAGLLERGPDPDDHRARAVTPTAEGWARLAAAGPGLRDAVHEHFGRALSDTAVRNLRRTLAVVIAGLGEEPERLAPGAGLRRR